MTPPIDFKIRKDQYGYYVVAYRIDLNTEKQYTTNYLIGPLLKLTAEEYSTFVQDVYKSEQEQKDGKLHFPTYDEAKNCMLKLRELVPKAIETDNLYIV